MSSFIHLILISFLCSISVSSNCSIFTRERNCTPKDVPQSQQCNHVKSCCNEMIGDGIIPYFQFVYCDLEGKKIFYLPFLMVTIIYLLIIIAIISQHYFAELMQEITKYLKLEANVAGATMVAWGNGIATMSSSITAISHGTDDGIKLGLGALFGVSVFNISFICATISLIAQNTIIDHYSLLIDSFYLIIISFYVIMTYLYGKITILLSITLVIMYILYVLCIWITTVITNYLAKKRFQKNQRHMAANVLASNSTHISTNLLYSTTGTEQTPSLAFGNFLSVSKSQRIHSILQIKNKHIILKIIIYILGFPVFIVWLLLKLTVPLPNYSHWNDGMACLHCITVPVLFYFAFIYVDIADHLHMLFHIIPFLIGIALSLMVCVKLRFKKPKSLKTLLRQRKTDHTDSTYGTIDTFQVTTVITEMGKTYSKSKDLDVILDRCSVDDNDLKYNTDIMNDFLSTEKINIKYDNDILKTEQRMYNKYVFEELSKQPVMKGLFLFLSFVSLITWIKIISEELISILIVLGTISEIDLTLLGIFVLSSVNSFPDLMNNVSVALKGSPQMAIAACFGGSSLEISVGFGVGALLGSLKNNNHILHLDQNSRYVLIACFYTIAICLIYVILIFFYKWKLNKLFGIFGYSFYLSFLIIYAFLFVL